MKCKKMNTDHIVHNPKELIKTYAYYVITFDDAPYGYITQSKEEVIASWGGFKTYHKGVKLYYDGKLIKHSK
jgi:hypothetical protein